MPQSTRSTIDPQRFLRYATSPVASTYSLSAHGKRNVESADPYVEAWRNALPLIIIGSSPLTVPATDFFAWCFRKLSIVAAAKR